MRRTLALLGVAAALLVFAAPQAQAQEGTGTVTVIHGVPGVDVDVYVNDELTLEGFAPETVTDPLELPAGDYQIDIRAAGAEATEDPLFGGSASLPAGANATLIAHLDESGAPTLGVFVNDTSQTAAGEGRLVVRHTAAAPAVDVLAGGEAVISDLANPDEASLALPAGTVSASVAAAGTTVSAIGSLEDDNLGVLVQTIEAGEAAGEATPPAEAPAQETPASEVPVPSGVPSGDSGLAASGGSTFPTGIALTVGAAAVAGMLVSARALAAARNRG